MKFIHLSDLHLGKRVNEFSMIDDQKYILKKILEVIKEEKPDAVLLVGDIYDRGPGPHVIMDTLCDYHSVDVQWGNHDIVWMGAPAASWPASPM